MLVITPPDPVGARRMIEIAKTLNPAVAVVLRSRSDEEATLLRAETDGAVFLDEQEVAQGMSTHILTRLRRSTRRTAPPISPNAS